jgi:14-3-3 protein epsilon
MFAARLAEQAERFEELAGLMRKVALLGGQMTAEEVDLLELGYKSSLRRRKNSLA